MGSTPTPVWLDCDPGHDDALAIILAGHCEKLKLLGVSTVAGNQTLDKVSQNALAVLDAAGLPHIDVVPGQAKPLMRPGAMLCPEIHGDSGLDGTDGGPILPASARQPLAGKAVPAMFEAISRAYCERGRARVHLVCTGALTNAALLLTLYPEVIPIIELTFMGGSVGIGNTGPVMEFNIQVDPEAAKMVLESGARITMVPLEVTHTALVTPDVLLQVAGTLLLERSPFLGLIRTLLLFFASSYRSTFGFQDPPLHDPCAVAYVIDPAMFKVELLRVDVETCSPLCAGQTVCDVWRQSGRPPNVYVAKEMDVPKFWRMMTAALHAADAASPLTPAAIP